MSLANDMSLFDDCWLQFDSPMFSLVDPNDVCPNDLLTTKCEPANEPAEYPQQTSIYNEFDTTGSEQNLSIISLCQGTNMSPALSTQISQPQVQSMPQLLTRMPPEQKLQPQPQRFSPLIAPLANIQSKFSSASQIQLVPVQNHNPQHFILLSKQGLVKTETTPHSSGECLYQDNHANDHSPRGSYMDEKLDMRNQLQLHKTLSQQRQNRLKARLERQPPGSPLRVIRRSGRKLSSRERQLELEKQETQQLKLRAHYMELITILEKKCSKLREILENIVANSPEYNSQMLNFLETSELLVDQSTPCKEDKNGLKQTGPVIRTHIS